MQCGSATGAPTRTLGCRVRRRQTVRAAGRVGGGEGRGPQTRGLRAAGGLAVVRHRYATAEIHSPRGRRDCFRDCLFHNAPDVYCHAARSALTGTRGKAWRLRLRGGVPRPRSLKPAFPERQIPRPNLGASFAELPSRRSQKKPGQQRDGEGKGRGVPPPRKPAGAARKAAGAVADGALAPSPSSRSPVSWSTK